MHQKTVGATGNMVQWLSTLCLPGDVQVTENVKDQGGVVTAENVGSGAEFAKTFIDGVAKHRVWEREVSHIAA